MSMLKLYCGALYDFQELKIQFGNRLTAAEAISTMPHERLDELQMFKKQLETCEDTMLKIIKPYLEEQPIYTEFLSKIKGCAIRMSAAVVSSIGDIERFPTISKLWAYAGLHVIDGSAVKRKKGENSNWNAFLKTKLYTLADCLMKLNFEGDDALRYRAFYDKYKHRIESRPKSQAPDYSNIKSKQVTYLPNGYIKGHVHAMALRYMQKMFLQDYWLKSWELIGKEPPSRPYAEVYYPKEHKKEFKPMTDEALGGKKRVEKAAAKKAKSIIKNTKTILKVGKKRSLTSK